jgi:hypothetical protein
MKEKKHREGDGRERERCHNNRRVLQIVSRCDVFRNGISSSPPCVSLGARCASGRYKHNPAGKSSQSADARKIEGEKACNKREAKTDSPSYFLSLFSPPLRKSTPAMTVSSTNATAVEETVRS